MTTVLECHWRSLTLAEQLYRSVAKTLGECVYTEDGGDGIWVCLSCVLLAGGPAACPRTHRSRSREQRAAHSNNYYAVQDELPRSTVQPWCFRFVTRTVGQARLAMARSYRSTVVYGGRQLVPGGVEIKCQSNGGGRTG